MKYQTDLQLNYFYYPSLDWYIKQTYNWIISTTLHLTETSNRPTTELFLLPFTWLIYQTDLQLNYFYYPSFDWNIKQTYNSIITAQSPYKNEIITQLCPLVNGTALHTKYKCTLNKTVKLGQTNTYITNSNIMSFFLFVNKRAICRLGIIMSTWAVHVTNFPVVNVNVDDRLFKFGSINCVRHCP